MSGLFSGGCRRGCVLALSLLLVMGLGERVIAGEMDSGEQERVYDLEDTVVTGTRTARRLSETPVLTEVVSMDRIESKGGTSLLDALAFEPGIRIDTQCSICNTAQVKLSGLPGRYTLLLIDGLPVFSSLGQTYGLANIPAADIERIEVVKGAASVLYGTDAIGGVINVITRRPTDKPRAGMRFEAGDFGFLNLMGHASMRRDQFGVSVVGNLTNHDKIDRDGDGVSEFSGYDRAYVSSAIHWDPRDDLNVMLRGSFGQERRQGGGMGSLLTAIDDDDKREISESVLSRRVDSAFKANWTPSPRLRLESTLGVTHHYQDSDYAGEIYVARQLMLFAQQAVFVDLAPRYHLLGGLSYRLERLSENIALSEYSYHMPGIFAQGEWHITDRVEWVHGARFDWHNEFGAVITPQTAFKFVPFDNLTIRASGGMGFRAPTAFFENFHGVRPEGYSLVYDACKAERSVSSGLSITYDGGRHIVATLSGSFNHVMNPISLETSESVEGEGVDQVRYFNADEALSVVSVELQAQSRPLSWLRPSLGYGFYHYDDPGGALLSAAPTHQITLGLDFPVDSIGFMASINAELNAPMDLRHAYGMGYGARPGTTLAGYLDEESAWDENRPKRSRSPWYGILNVRVEQRIWGGLSVFAGVENLLDYHQADKESPIFFPMEDGMLEPADVIYIWGPMRGRFIYGGLKLEI